MRNLKHDYVSFDSIEAGSKDGDINGGDQNERESLYSWKSDTRKTHKKKNPIFGYAFMLFAMTGTTMNHFFGKLAMHNNPNLSGFDVLFFTGLLATT